MGSPVGSFHDDIILREIVTISAIIKVFIRFQSLCFSKIVTHWLKSTMETLSVTFPEKFLIDMQC